MTYIPTSPQAYLQSGDTLVRPKDNGLGSHYGTWLSMGAVAHTTPGYGKHLGTFDEFAAGKPVGIIRPSRTIEDNFLTEFRAIEDLGKKYDVLAANCEQDVTRVHEGAARSPSVGWAVAGVALAVVGIVGTNWE
ncbi:MAG: hypothetical protein WBV36_17915 [Terriglobales bacterium]